jgi:putative hydrolase of the HAD superfamily
MVECAGSNGPADKHEKSFMIKNVIFDLGNVLVSFRPAEYLETQNYTEEKKKIILAEIFGSPEWLMLDNGDLTTREAISLIAGRSSLKRAEIDEIFDKRFEILVPINPNLKILPELKKQGLKLYYLSNFPLDLWEMVKERMEEEYGFFRYFDGGIISGEARFSKPDPQIYKLLLEKYSLNADECFYIDDIEINVRAAEKTGMTGLSTDGTHDLFELLKKTIPF